MLPAAIARGESSAYSYASPQPGSQHVSPWNDIAVRLGEAVDPGSVARSSLSVVGTISGSHRGAWALSDDGRTLLFTPDQPFALGESVAATLSGDARTARGQALPPLSFDFQISLSDPRQSRARPLEEELLGAGAPAPSAAARALEAKLAPSIAQVFSPQPCDTMPSNYLSTTIMQSNQPDSGCIFITPNASGAGSLGHLAIVDNYGVPMFAQALGGVTSTLDFKLQPTGQLSYFINNQFTVLDSNYTVVDHWACGNGYLTDSHEFLLLPNGHALMMAYDAQIVDMSMIVPGGNPAATVIGLIVQELDATKHVVLQWRSWDHYKITDMIEVPGRSFTGASIDWVHGNAIEVALDGNLLISARHMDEITKVDRQTGAIIWRLGLNSKNNQFTIVNDPRGFSHQHDIRQLPNGDITVFDNGNYLTPQYSRGVEYALDETNRIATQVWEYRHVPDIYGQATGSDRRRENGGKLIAWGLNTPDPKITDLHADDSIALELGFGAVNIFSYRAFRFPWHTTQFEPDVYSLDIGPVLLGQSLSLPLTLHNHLHTDIPLTCFASSDPAFSVLESVPLMLPADSEVVVHVAFTPAGIGPASARLYVRSVQGSSLVAQEVDVTGSGTGVLSVGGRAAGMGLWLSSRPNPARGPRTLSFGMPRAGHVTLEIFDLAGRHVATPFAGSAEPGEHQVLWNSRAHGAPLTGGVYFAVLSTPFGSRSVKLVSLDR
ncbi:MAG: aryl-sulfate sulfotransferase [Candidatus Eiseniibacteriota bacterium]